MGELKQTLKMEKEENADQKARIHTQTRGTPSPRAVSWIVNPQITSISTLVEQTKVP